MSIVLDANALIVLALDQRRASIVEQLLRAWANQDEVLHAPELLPYEVASALSRAEPSAPERAHELVCAPA